MKLWAHLEIVDQGTIIDASFIFHQNLNFCTFKNWQIHWCNFLAATQNSFRHLMKIIDFISFVTVSCFYFLCASVMVLYNILISLWSNILISHVKYSERKWQYKNSQEASLQCILSMEISEYKKTRCSLSMYVCVCVSTRMCVCVCMYI
jgi:hypothetical protein